MATRIRMRKTRCHNNGLRQAVGRAQRSACSTRARDLIFFCFQILFDVDAKRALPRLSALLLFLFSFLAGGAVYGQLDVARIADERNSPLSQEEKDTLLRVLDMIARTPSGKRIVAEAKPETRFSVRPMTKNLGLAAPNGEIALGRSRMESAEAAGDEKERKTHWFVLADATAHELTHSAQFAAGFAAFPQDATFEEAVAQRMMMELEAKLVGEAVQQEMLRLPEYADMNVPLITIYGEMLGRTSLSAAESANPERSARTAFVRALWEGRIRDSFGRYSDRTIQGIRAWNRIYWETAATSELARLENADSVRDRAKLTHLFQTWIRRLDADLTPEYFLETSPLRVAGRTAAFYENGSKLCEISALGKGTAVRKEFNPAGELIGLRQLCGPTLSLFQETDGNGALVRSIPMKNGAADGIGWDVHSGRKTMKRFRAGTAVEIVKTSDAEAQEKAMQDNKTQDNKTQQGDEK